MPVFATLTQLLGCGGAAVASGQLPLGAVCFPSATALPSHTLHDPAWLWALLLLPLLWWLRSLRGAPVLVVPFAGAWHRTGSAPLRRWPMAAASLGLALLLVGLARPQHVQQRQEERKEGYDIVLAIDISGSMLSEDYEKGGSRINRLQAVTPVLDAFIQRRPSDRIGLVVFSGHAYTLSPLTLDHDWLRRQAERLRVGLIEDGTAIGDGLGVALTRLEQSKREQGGKRLGAFIVLLTDGVNNRGALPPLQGASIAKARGIPVYTIGAGRTGVVPMPVFRDGKKVGYERTWSETDERTLQAIARETGGEFFRATDSGTVEAAFAAIDRAKRIEFEARSFLLTEELFPWWVVPGALLVLFGALTSRPFGAAARATG